MQISKYEKHKTDPQKYSSRNLEGRCVSTHQFQAPDKNEVRQLENVPREEKVQIKKGRRF